nr:serine/threonine-protein kinase CBK1-like [Procambarus clarkii]
MSNALQGKIVDNLLYPQNTAQQQGVMKRKLSQFSSHKSDVSKRKCTSREQGTNLCKSLELKKRSAILSSKSSQLMELNTIPRVKKNDLTQGNVLGNGAQGLTYTGTLTQGSTCTPVVIKQLHFPNNGNILNEAKVLLDIKGAGGAPLLFGNTQEKTFRLVMSNCPGDTLQSYLNNNTPHDCLQAFIKLCAAVEEIHKKGYVHQDLHTENIIVEETSSNFIIHIIDMGYAKIITKGFFDEAKSDYKKLLDHAKEIAQYLDSSTKYATFKSIVEEETNTGESVKRLVEAAKKSCVECITPPPEAAALEDVKGELCRVHHTIS